MHYLSVLVCGALLVFLAEACNKEHWDGGGEALESFSPDELDYTHRHFCRTPNRIDGVEDRSTGQKGKYWAAGTVLRVRFLNGHPQLKAKVMEYAKTWEQHANITFTMVTSGRSEIRIRFGNNGNDSYIGTDNNTVSQKAETMNLYWHKKIPAEEFRATVLHEFGHVLGLMHEHQNPLGNIPWDKPKVYEYFWQTDSFTEEMVDHNILNKFSPVDVHYTVFDSLSIMAYYIPATLTIGNYSIPNNTEISEIDKSLISKLYSGKTIRLRHAADISDSIFVKIGGLSRL